jgi:anti-sigma B factor antagonist
MTISSDPLTHDSLGIVRLPAEVDLATAQEVRDSLLSTVNRGGIHLVVDATDVTFIDSTGVNALIRGRERAELLGGSVHVASDASSVRRVLEVTQLSRVLHLVPTMEQALECISDPDHMHRCDDGA